MKIIALLCLVLSGFINLSAQSAFNATDLITMQRVSSPSISPDGRYVSYLVRSTDLEANKGTTEIWVTRLSDNKAIQVTKHPASDYSPQWAKDSQHIYFLSTRHKGSQIWKTHITKKEPVQVTQFPLSVTSFKISKHNNRIIFSSAVVPSCEDFACTKNYLAKEKQKQASGIVYDKMFVRHWDHWIGSTQSQIFSVDLNKNGLLANQKITPLSATVFANVPSDPFGGNEEYTMNADASKVYFAAKIQDKNEPTSTNFDIYQVSVANPSKAINLTQSNLAWDTQPILSSDGNTLAYLAMRRPGFEADRFEVVLKDLKTGKNSYVTKDWDRSFSSLQFSSDNQYLFLTGNHLGTKALWRFNIKTGERVLFNQSGWVTSPTVGNQKIIYAMNNLKQPNELYLSSLDGKKPQQITFVNTKKLSQVKLGDYEQFKFKGWNDETVYGYLVKPVDFDPNKKYPLAFLIHGGPQGSFADRFHYRWNPQTYAGQGYVAVMIDFHGSTGYGQAFTDSISQNWGSKPFEDLQKGMAFIDQQYAFIDTNNACALGASYGGYMINWIAGNWPDQFKCLVNHDGVFDNRMMYYSTEELWFVEWENGGPYFKSPDIHEKYNPVNYVNNWKTPMLVVQGELDYRIPVTQSLATFTALQRKGIKSKLLYFPDENHWVLKPHNSLQWHHEVNLWLKEFLD
ncbi:prolyl oligopeptidase family serine peptidase [Aliikangiella sp. IMCC44653]